MAIRKQIEIDIDTRDAIKSMTALGGTFEDVFGEVKPLTAEIGELEDVLYQMALAGDTSSKEFKDLQKQVSSMKKVIIDADLAIDGMSQTMAQQVGGAVGGLASGFELAQGAMAAFGVESEQVEEALLKVQSAMAISQGIQGIKEASASFRGLGSSAKQAFKGMTKGAKAFALTGIGVLITAVVALAMNLDKVKASLSGLTKQQRLSNEATKMAIENINEELSASDKLQKTLKSENISREDKRKAVKQLQEQYPDLLANVDAEKDGLSEINKQLELNTKLLKLNAEAKAIEELRSEKYKERLQEEVDTGKGWVEFFGDAVNPTLKETGFTRKADNAIRDNTIKGIDKELNSLDKLSQQRQKDIAQIKEQGAALGSLTEKFNFAAGAVGSLATEQQGLADKWAKWAAERLAASRLIEDLITENLKDENKKRLEVQRLAFERSIEDLKTDATKTDAEKRQIELQLTETYERDRAALIQTIRNETHDLQLEARGTQLEKEYQQEEYHLKGMLALYADQEQKKQELEQQTRDAKVQLATDGFQLVANIAELFANKSERAARIAFKVQKAASIAQATVAGIEGTINAFKTASASPITIGFPAYPFIQAGLAAGFAATNIATIASSQFQGGGASTVSGAVGSPNIGNAGSNVANFNVVGNTGVNQLAETLGNNQTVKAYVVSTDVTTAQSLDRNKVETATI
jgi:hypothetical protein